MKYKTNKTEKIPERIPNKFKYLKKNYIIFITFAILLSIFLIGTSKPLLTPGEITKEISAPDWYYKKSYEGSDESKIVIEGSGKTHTWTLFKVYSDGRREKLKTINIFQLNTNPQWSPDGKKILFGGLDGYTPSRSSGILFVINSDGSGFKKLTPRRFDVWSKGWRWSPDGEKIVFLSRRYGRCENVWIMDSDGSNKVRLTKEGCHDNPIWNPEGNKIAYQVKYKVKDSLFGVGLEKGIYTINLIEKTKLKAIIDHQMEFSGIISHTLFLAVILTILYALHFYRLLPFKLLKIIAIVYIIYSILSSGILTEEYYTSLEYHRWITSLLALSVITSAFKISSTLYKKRIISSSTRMLIYIGAFLFTLWSIFIFIFSSFS